MRRKTFPSFVPSPSPTSCRSDTIRSLLCTWHGARCVATCIYIRYLYLSYACAQRGGACCTEYKSAFVRVCCNEVRRSRTRCLASFSVHFKCNSFSNFASCHESRHGCADANGAGLTPATSALGLGSPRPHLRRDCAGTDLIVAHVRLAHLLAVHELREPDTPRERGRRTPQGRGASGTRLSGTRLGRTRLSGTRLSGTGPSGSRAGWDTAAYTLMGCGL